MVAAQTKDNKVYTVIYSESILALDKSHKLIFIAINEKENFKFTLIFDFDNIGEAFSTTVWDLPETDTLIYLLHKWESSTWVEISKPTPLKGKGINGEYYLKFRSTCSENLPHRKFEVTIWKNTTVETYG